MKSDFLNDKLRKILDSCPKDAKAAAYLSEHSPQCECEAAFPCKGGFGPVHEDEILTYFITHPQQTKYRIKDQKLLKERPFGYKPQVFDAAFSVGISIMRENNSSNEELCIQAKKIATRLRSTTDSKGGVLAVVHFPASAIFEILSDNQRRQFCVYDTPINVGRADAVMAHGDIFATANGKDIRVQRSSLRVKIYDAITKVQDTVNAVEYRGGIFKPHLATFD